MYPFHLEVKKDYQAVSRYTSDLIIQTMQNKPEGLYCFAGGDTPVLALQQLAEAHRQGLIDLTKAYYIELDEWVGLPQENEGSCLSYLKRNLFDASGVPADHIHSFHSMSQDLESECRQANAYIVEHGNITLSLLGVGENGHLGFNEPFVSFDLCAHVVSLTESTRIVGQKYFNSKIELSQGISLGIRQLMESEVLVIEACGEKKRQAISRLLKGTVMNEWPVTIAGVHKNCYVVVDEAAMKEI